MLAKVESAHFVALEAKKVEVEVDITNGLPSFTIVGLTDTAIQESKERVRSAILNSEFDWPLKKVTVNLAPADFKKEGPSFDLPIAIGILMATSQLKSALLEDALIVGQLSLSGEIRPVNGALLLAHFAQSGGKKRFILPSGNVKEASIVKGLKVAGLKTLRQTHKFLSGEIPEPEIKAPSLKPNTHYDVDFNEVKGQQMAKRALEIAASGEHNVLFIGSPGSGKTMLAKRFSTIMPDLSVEEAIEITKIYSICGLTQNNGGLINKRPFRSPHHTISPVGLAGGGQYPKPGEITLSHNGVLFLDELSEFNQSALEVLRQPLEENKVTISRALSSLTFPAKFILVSATNPCRCGWFGDKYKECQCTPNQIRRYRQKISGPLLDRVDLHLNIGRLKRSELVEIPQTESSQTIKKRVLSARKTQQRRFKRFKFKTNAHMKTAHLRKFCILDKESSDFLGLAIERFGLTARSYDKVLKVSRTIADLARSENIKLEHLAEALQYRSLDRAHGT